MADKEEKILVFDPTLCTGCMRCMTTCSTYNTGATSLSKSRIFVVRHEGHALTKMDEEDELIFEALACRQCDKPYCMYFCPTRAISRSQDTGAMTINYDRCIGCRMCMVGCPFGAIIYDADRKRVVKCELCEGEPQCVRLCPAEALKYLPKRLANLPKRERLAKSIVELKPTVAQEVPVREDKHVGS